MSKEFLNYLKRGRDIRTKPSLAEEKQASGVLRGPVWTVLPLDGNAETCTMILPRLLFGNTVLQNSNNKSVDEYL